ncbi:MAG: protein kinase domain-containing protein [Actinomycetota bacterium]
MPNNLVSGRYKIIKKIASGGMAEIYLGRDLKLERKVAIKILSQNYASDKSFVARFKQEAQILAKLNHPNIVQIYDWGKYKDSYFICMEYIEGSNLKDIIERRGIIAPRLAAKYAIEICNALEAAHKNNLIHRDIKPQNILVTNGNSVKVTDFGIAKSVVDDVTKTINIIGTAKYISPEQASGNKIDHRTDIYSLGIVLYEMITADVPFRGESSIEISLKHINEPPVKPSSLVDLVTPDIEKIILHCLEKDADNRYHVISELKKDLKNYLEHKKLSIDKPKKKKKFPKNQLLKPVFKGINILNIISFAVILALLSLTLFYSVNYYQLNNLSQQVTVPPIENMEYSQASQILGYFGLKLSNSGEEFSNVVPEGAIIDQDPEPGTDISADTEIKATVSKGPENIDVGIPNTVGLGLGEAKAIIEDSGLKIGEIKEEHSDIFKKNTVTSQSPTPYKEVPLSSKVNLTVSLGKEIITIPNIIGTDYLYAKSHLQSLGLEIITGKKHDNSYLPGTVVETYPPPGSEIDKGNTINIYISTTQEMLTVPNLMQKSLEEATNTLSSLGIRYEIREVEAPYSVQKGLVLGQFPEADEYILPESPVILFIGS